MNLYYDIRIKMMGGAVVNKQSREIEKKLSEISAKLSEGSDLLRKAETSIVQMIAKVQCEIEEIYVSIGNMPKREQDK